LYAVETYKLFDNSPAGLATKFELLAPSQLCCTFIVYWYKYSMEQI